MQTTPRFVAAMIDGRVAADPASGPLLDALRAGGSAVSLLAVGSFSPPTTVAGGGKPQAFDRSRTIIVTAEPDAVRRARNDRFGFVAGIAAAPAVGGGAGSIPTADAKRALRQAGADLVVPSAADLSLDEIDAWFDHREVVRPSIPAHLDAVARRIAGRTPVLFLDYDGTLTPIVARPELAQLDAEMRRTLSELAGTVPTVIVSGRGREDVARLVGIEGLIYAGSHGFDIAGPAPASLPGRAPVRHQVAAGLQPALRRAADSLAADLAAIPGVLIEDKRFAVTVHFRQVAADRVAEIELAVDRVVAAATGRPAPGAAPRTGGAERMPALRKTSGKKVLEVRPDVEWDKGRAVLWLLQALELDGEEAVPIYLGDDTTDEDAFLALGDRGVTALVARTPRPTAAAYALQDCEEVGDFLRFLVSGGRSSGATGMKLA